MTMGTAYFLVLKPGTAGMHDTWNNSDPAAFGNGAYFSTDDSTWNFNEQQLPAFRLTVASTPDSGSTFGLLGLALVALVGASRFRSIRLA